MSLLECRNVTKHFGGLRAIEDLSFAVEPGEILGLIGPNGAGKTTLFAMASGFLPPTAGEIFFKGRRIDRRPPPEICRRGLVRTFQIVRPFGDMSVLDNVLVGAFLRHKDVAEARRVALAVLAEVGLAQRAAQAARTLTLSGCKRLEVAKAIATQPKLLLLDEVMAGLTKVEIEEMMALVRRLCQGGITMVMIEHNMHAVMNLSDRVLVLHHGRKIGAGKPEAIVNDPAVIAAYLGERED
ncbi:MAG: ABC transporter ATP-binding protein [Xanthobacteraceae bacterium]|jgi:branched-chain amino acid transport system ATP-binding protein